MDEKMDPLKAVEALTEAIREVGDAFAAGDYFLPELLGAAEAMQSAMPILDEVLKTGSQRRASAGKVVAGTVAGDIHNIGKSIFCTLLSAEGFEVIDLGVDVSVESFLTAIKQNEPDIVAMSALLTITSAEQKNVIEALEKEGIRTGSRSWSAAPPSASSSPRASGPTDTIPPPWEGCAWREACWEREGAAPS